MINWKVRFRNGKWVMGFVSQVLIVLQMFVAGLNQVGIIEFQLTDQIQGTVLTFVNAVLVLLSMMGIIQDPTTRGYGDSQRAMKYVKPD